MSVRAQIDAVMVEIYNILSTDVGLTSQIKHFYQGMRNVIPDYPSIIISITSFDSSLRATNIREEDLQIQIFVYVIDMDNGENVVRKLACDVIDVLRSNISFNGTVYDNGASPGYTVDIGMATKGNELPFAAMVEFKCKATQPR